MTTKLIVTADLGGWRAFRMVQAQEDSQPHLEPLTAKRLDSSHERLSSQVTDSAGRFPGGAGARGGANGMAYGERHNRQLEQRRRQLREVADGLDRLLKSNEVTSCWLAAAREIQSGLVDELSPETRRKIRRQVPLDLMGAPAGELLQHFDRAANGD